MPKPPSRLYPEAAIVALLTVNAVYYATFGTLAKAADALAWLVLLVLFEIEMHFPGRVHSAQRVLALRIARVAAAIGIIAAALGYVVERDVLDAINSALWIAVVVLLEIELRWPDAVDRARRVFTSTASALYASLGALVLAWAARGEWFDAYDAALWLLAFGALEMDVLKRHAT